MLLVHLFVSQLCLNKYEGSPHLCPTRAEKIPPIYTERLPFLSSLAQLQLFHILVK